MSSRPEKTGNEILFRLLDLCNISVLFCPFDWFCFVCSAHFMLLSRSYSRKHLHSKYRFSFFMVFKYNIQQICFQMQPKICFFHQCNNKKSERLEQSVASESSQPCYYMCSVELFLIYNFQDVYHIGVYLLLLSWLTPLEDSALLILPKVIWGFMSLIRKW